MTIDPKEQAFLDNLKAEFKKDGKGLSRIENKVLEALALNFDAKDVNGNDVITGAADAMQIVKKAVNDDQKQLNKEIADTTKDIADIDQALKKVGGFIDLGKAKNKVVKATKEGALMADKRHLEETNTFEKTAYPTITAMANGQLPAKTTVAAVTTDTPASKPPVAETPAVTATPAAAATGHMSASEAAFLQGLKEGYARNGNGKLSGIEQRVCNELEAEFNKPGQTGWKEIAGIANDVQTKMIEGVKSGAVKLSEVIRGASSWDDKAISENIKDTEAAKLLPDSKKKTKTLEKLAETRKEKEAKFETRILEQFSWNPIVERAKQNGFPENSVAPTAQQLAVIAAAGTDKVLDSKELQTLLKDKNFMGGAQKIGVTQGAENKDKLTVGGADVSLDDVGIRLDDAIKDGDVSLPKAAAPAKTPAKKTGRGH